MADFPIPEFLQNQTIEQIHARMLSSLPSDLDVSEGQFPWIFTRPVAIEKARFAEDVILRALSVVFPAYSYGAYVDLHAATRGLQRRAATKATGTVQVKGQIGTVIPKDSIFTTSGSTYEDSLIFRSQEEITIGSNGIANIPVICDTPGVSGNVKANTIVISASAFSSPLTSVTNPSATSGGTDKETDESLIARIAEYDSSRDVSYVGSVSDYKRWAKEVPGVGDAVVIPATDDTGMVTIVLTGSDGNPASPALCQDVYYYIMGSSEDDRKASINALLTVSPPTVERITISATIEVDANSNIDTIRADFLTQIQSYLAAAADDGVVRISEVGRILKSISGVTDYSSLMINDGTTNIILANTQLPLTSADLIELTESGD